MINTNKPKFITFEGVVGSGKSTQCKMLYEYLLGKGIDVCKTREIGGTRIAELIRDIVIYEDVLPFSELLLIMAARYEHIHKVITPALASNKWLICDRFIDSSACYQGLHQDMGMEKVYQLHQELLNNFMPNITFFIDVKPHEALNRIPVSYDSNKFETKDIEFHNKVYEGFQTITERFKNRIISIKADQLTKEQVHQKILEALFLESIQ